LKEFVIACYLVARHGFNHEPDGIHRLTQCLEGGDLVEKDRLSPVDIEAPLPIVWYALFKEASPANDEIGLTPAQLESLIEKMSAVRLLNANAPKMPVTTKRKLVRHALQRYRTDGFPEDLLRLINDQDQDQDQDRDTNRHQDAKITPLVHSPPGNSLSPTPLGLDTVADRTPVGNGREADRSLAGRSLGSKPDPSLPASRGREPSERKEAPTSDGYETPTSDSFAFEKYVVKRSPLLAKTGIGGRPAAAVQDDVGRIGERVSPPTRLIQSGEEIELEVNFSHQNDVLNVILTLVLTLVPTLTL